MFTYISEYGEGKQIAQQQQHTRQTLEETIRMIPVQKQRRHVQQKRWILQNIFARTLFITETFFSCLRAVVARLAAAARTFYLGSYCRCHNSPPFLRPPRSLCAAGRVFLFLIIFFVGFMFIFCCFSKRSARQQTQNIKTRTTKIALKTKRNTTRSEHKIMCSCIAQFVYQFISFRLVLTTNRK